VKAGQFRERQFAAIFGRMKRVQFRVKFKTVRQAADLLGERETLLFRFWFDFIRKIRNFGNVNSN
jgi:hypothetical protein